MADAGTPEEVRGDLTFLSDAWFADAEKLLVGSGAERPGTDARIRYRAEAVCSRDWYASIEGGRLAVWEPDGIAEVDAEVRWAAEDAFAILAGSCTGADALLATTIVDRRPGGTYVGAPLPLDLNDEPALADMRRIPGADLTLHTLLHDGPFGPAPVTNRFVDGRLERVTAGLIGDPDVVIELPYRQLVLVREGAISILDALQHGAVRGSIEAIGCLAGLLESPAYQRAMAATVTGRAPSALATLGELVATPGYRDAMVALMGQDAS